MTTHPAIQSALTYLLAQREIIDRAIDALRLAPMTADDTSVEAVHRRDAPRVSAPKPPAPKATPAAPKAARAASAPDPQPITSETSLKSAILRVLRERAHPMRLVEIVDRLASGYHTTRSALKALRDKNLVQTTGRAKAARWSLVAPKVARAGDGATQAKPAPAVQSGETEFEVAWNGSKGSLQNIGARS